jgi:hypothetical protein
MIQFTELHSLGIDIEVPSNPMLEKLYLACTSDDRVKIVEAIEDHMNYHFAGRQADSEHFIAMDCVQKDALAYLEARQVEASPLSTARSAYELCKYQMRRRPGD